MKQFALTIFVGFILFIGVFCYKVIFNIFYADSASWQNEHFFQILWFLTFTFITLSTSFIFRPRLGSRQLAEVVELVDETLTEIGPIEGGISNRVDSVEYGVELEKRLRLREQND